MNTRHQQRVNPRTNTHLSSGHGHERRRVLRYSGLSVFLVYTRSVLELPFQKHNFSTKASASIPHGRGVNGHARESRHIFLDLFIILFW